MSVYHKSGNAEADEKLGLAALLAQSATPGVATTGVLWGLAVTQTATASGSVQVAQGAGAVQASLTPGASLLYNPAPTLNILTANPVGSLPRNDIVVFDSTTGNVAAIIGTANATPTDPTVPNTALKLARIRNIANAVAIDSGHIDDLRTYTSLVGVGVPAYGRYGNGSGKNIPTATWTVVDSWGASEVSNMTYSAGVWTIQVAGRYKVDGQITFGAVASPSGQRAVRLYLNGTVVDEFAGARADTSYNTPLPVKCGFNAQPGDTVSIQAYQNQGSSQPLTTGAGMNHISIDRVSGV